MLLLTHSIPIWHDRAEAPNKDGGVRKGGGGQNVIDHGAVTHVTKQLWWLPLGLRQFAHGK